MLSVQRNILPSLLSVPGLSSELSLKKGIDCNGFFVSYQDNAHARAEQYKQNQRGWPYAGGRFTNGKVMVCWFLP